MKATPINTKASVRTPAASALKAKKESMVRGERTPSRVFRVEKQPDGTVSRVAVNPESQRRKSAKAWEAKSEVAKVRHSLDLTQDAFADLLGIGLSTLRSWEQKKREPSGAARMLIAIALKHPEVLQEALA
jgi:DNA-binding transcriptional regulator YiaG